MVVGRVGVVVRALAARQNTVVIAKKRGVLDIIRNAVSGRL